MIETVVSVEDIKKVYGEKFELHERTEQSSRLEKMGYEFLDEYLPVSILKSMGPFSTVCIKNQLAKRFIIPSEFVIQKELPNAIDSYKPILDKYFPNQWWFNVKYGWLYLYYPELEIKNSMGLKHTIYDIVISFNFNSETGTLTDIRGKRYSFTRDELISGYVHSHLPKFNGTDEDGEDCALIFESFCTGGDSHFTRLLASMNKRNSSKELELFLIQLEEYLKWESLEGKPFISMVNINSANTDKCTYSDVLEYSLRFRIVKFVIEELNKHVVIPVLPITMGAYVLDPSHNPQWFYTNIEQPIVEKFKEELDLRDWDNQRQQYIGTASTDNVELWRLDKEDNDIITNLDITPRLIEQEVVEHKTTVKRLTTSTIQEIIQEVTNMLVKGSVKQTKIINE